MRALTKISFVIAWAAVAATASAQPQYQIFDIGVVQKTDTASQGISVSHAGVAVGRVFQQGSASQAFSWTLGGGIVGLPKLAGRAYAVSNSANDNGMIVGTAADTFFGSNRLPVVWQKGVITQLPLPPGEVIGDATGVNAAGIAVGSVDGGSLQQGVIYKGASSAIITETTSTGCTFVTAFGINDAGRIVGFGIDPNNAARNVGIVLDFGDTSAFEVGAIPGANGAIAFGVANGGYVVGSSMMNQGSGTPFIYSDQGGIRAIPLATGTSEGSARAVNSSGWVVGQDSSAFSIPFLWDGTTTYRLADLLPAGSGWDLDMNTSSSAEGISDDGVIVGTGVHNGDTHAYAMVPLQATPTPSPTATGTPCSCSPTPTSTPTPTPIPTATPTPPLSTPTPTPPKATPTPGSGAAQAVNLSTRLLDGTGNNVGIGGFIITGSAPKDVLLRAIGPSLTVPGPLADPVMALHGPSPFVTITNDNWRDTQEAEIIATGIPPTNNLESAIRATLNPGSYTAVVSGNGTGIGVALVEIYDLDQAAASKLGNISTRAFVNTGNNIVIAGFILGNSTGNDTVVIRGLGPSVGLTPALADPMLELRDSSGTLLLSNDNWMDDPVQAAECIEHGLGPTNSREACMVATVPPGPYTALLSGVNNGTGLGLVEVYDNPAIAATPTPTPAGGGGTPTPTPSGGGTPTPTPGGVCTESFDGVTAPALPAGWVASNPDPGDGVMFVTSTALPDTAPNSAFIPDQDGISDKVLDSRPIMVSSAAAVMTFRNNFNSEFSGGVYWDGGVLEVSSPNISNGDFLDITDSHVGGSITSGGYTGEISSDAMNPLAGRMAWSGDSGGYIDTAINLGPNVAGQTITLRFRFGSDEAVSAPGWNVDTISITGATCP